MLRTESEKRKARPDADELWVMCELKGRSEKMASEVSRFCKQELELSLSDVMIRNTNGSP